MVLALALAMVLMLALYLTLSTYMTSTQIGRDVLAEGEIARSVMARLSHDITNQLGAFDTRCLPDYAAAAADPAATPDPTMAPTVIPNSVPVDAVGFNVGVHGSANTLRLSVYRVENPAVGNIAKTNEQQSDILCDLRRIDYWLVSSGDTVLGLARREIKMATSDDIDTEPSEISEQEKYIIAPEVKSLTFQFHNGQSWTEEWDGSAPKDLSGADGTPNGPPAAVKITMKIQRKMNKLLTPNAAETLGPAVQYTFVVAVPTSNNFTPKTTSP
jgi:hypothetical protein